MLVYLEAQAGTLDPSEPSAALVRQLVGFERLGSIQPGAATTHDFDLTTDDFELHDAAGARKLFPGSYAIVLSTGSSASEVRVGFECSSTACVSAQYSQ